MYSQSTHGVEAHHSGLARLRLTRRTWRLSAKLARGFEGLGDVPKITSVAAFPATKRRGYTYVSFSLKMPAICSLSQSSSFRAE